MTGVYVVAVEGLEALDSIEDLPKAYVTAARRAVNKTVQRTRAASAREIRRQVNLPARYVSGQNGRLRITKLATGNDLEGKIAGRERPTSLARFLVGNGRSHGGANVQVKPGTVRRIPRAFPIKLRAGAADIDTKFNLGLAIRLRPGETIRNKRQFVKLASNLYLLYGPSVNQVFASVANEEAPDAAIFLEQEFSRLMDLEDA